MKYECHFVGRNKGAIGLTYPRVRIVEADSKDEARLKLYDMGFEHIYNFKAYIIAEETPAHDCNCNL